MTNVNTNASIPYTIVARWSRVNGRFSAISDRPQLDARCIHLVAAHLEHDARERAVRRTGHRTSGSQIERPLMARAEQAIVPGFRNDSAREMRALLTVCDELARRRMNEDAAIGLARVGEGHGAADRDLGNRDD